MFLKLLYALTLVTSLSNNTLFANDGCCNIDSAKNITCGWVNKKIYCAHSDGGYYVYILKNNCNLVGTTAIPDTQNLCSTIDPDIEFCNPPCEGAKREFSLPHP